MSEEKIEWRWAGTIAFYKSYEYGPQETKETNMSEKQQEWSWWWAGKSLYGCYEYGPHDTKEAAIAAFKKATGKEPQYIFWSTPNPVEFLREKREKDNE